MKVKELIKKLKTMPQNLEVGFAHSDVGPGTIDGWIFDVNHMNKEELINQDHHDIQDDMPDDWVALSN